MTGSAPLVSRLHMAAPTLHGQGPLNTTFQSRRCAMRPTQVQSHWISTLQ